MKRYQANIEKNKKLKQKQLNFNTQWNFYERKKSYSDLKDNYLKDYFKLSMVKTHLKTVRRSFQKQRYSNSINFKNAINQKLNQFKLEKLGRKKSAQREKQIINSQPKSVKKEKKQKQKTRQQERKLRKTKINFMLQKSIDHEYHENQGKLLKKSITHEEFEAFLNQLRGKTHRESYIYN